jgi:hypothetical protein
MSETWTALSSLAAIFGLAVVTYAAVVALRQLREMTRTRHLEAMLRVYEQIGNDAARSDRRYIYNKLTSAPERVSDQDREHIERVTVLLDRIGKLVLDGLVPEYDFFDTHAETVIRCWRVLQPHVHDHRKVTGGRHGHYFEELTNEAEEYWKAMCPGLTINIVKSSSP